VLCLLVLCYLCSDEKEEEDWRRSLLLLPERKEGVGGRRGEVATIYRLVVAFRPHLKNLPHARERELLRD
jgi:hypothetical protein